ncbi:hypothetical protein ACFQZK_00790 [Rhodococcus aetherivorans]
MEWLAITRPGARGIDRRKVWTLMPNGLSFIANWCLTKDYWREDTPSVWAFENIDVEEARQVALEVPQLSPETHGSSYASILKNRYEPWNHIAESEEVKEGVVSKKIVVVGAAKQIILGLNSESRSKMADCLSNELVPPINVTFSRSEGENDHLHAPEQRLDCGDAARGIIRKTARYPREENHIARLAFAGVGTRSPVNSSCALHAPDQPE